MTTPRTQSLVSIALSLTLTLTLGGCVSAPSRSSWDRPAPINESPLTIRFDNEAGDYVRVYLVGGRRQWLLGRAEAGARTTLRIPDDALAPSEGWMRLVVVVGGSVSLRAADEPGATVAMAQPTAEILSQRWTFARSVSTGRLAAAQLARPRVEVRRE